MKITNQQIEGNITKYYVSTAFSSFLFYLPIFVLFLQAKGLTIAQALTLQAIQAVVIFILEVPTSAIADIIGRKKTVVLGMLFSTIGFIMFILAINMFWFVIAMIVTAFGGAISSGADTALIYDSLKKLKKEKLFKKIEGKAQAISFTILAFSAFLSGFLYTKNIHFPFVLSILPMLISIIIINSMHEPTHYKTKATYNNTLKMIREGIKFMADNKLVRWLVLYTSIFMAFDIVLYWLFQPYLIGVGVKITQIGIVFAVMNIVIAFASFYAHKIESVLGETFSIVLIPSFLVLSFILLATGNIVLGLFAIILSQLSWGYSNPVISDYINRHVPSKNRATVLSIKSLSICLVSSAVLPFVGLLVDAYSLSFAFIISAGLIFVINIILYVMRKI